jgi:hypothetical protein
MRLVNGDGTAQLPRAAVAETRVSPPRTEVWDLTLEHVPHPKANGRLLAHTTSPSEGEGANFLGGDGRTLTYCESPRRVFEKPHLDGPGEKALSINIRERSLQSAANSFSFTIAKLSLSSSRGYA